MSFSPNNLFYFFYLAYKLTWLNNFARKWFWRFLWVWFHHFLPILSPCLQQFCFFFWDRERFRGICCCAAYFPFTSAWDPRQHASILSRHRNCSGAGEHSQNEFIFSSPFHLFLLAFISLVVFLHESWAKRSFPYWLAETDIQIAVLTAYSSSFHAASSE